MNIAARTVLLVGAFTCASATRPACGFDLPREAAVPGGVKIIQLVSHASSPPQVDADGHRALVVSEGPRWLAVVGIPLSAAPGEHAITMRDPGPQRIEYSVADKHYVSQSLKVTPGQVNLSLADLSRVQIERGRIDRALAAFSEPPPESMRLPPPVAGARSSSFGSRRIFNGEARNPHSGMDIAAPLGTTVRLPVAGIVVETGDFFFNGNTVIVDHGRGFLSMYCHLNAVDVKAGDRLAAGARIGAVGKTGRATGPHLHWGLSLNRVWVDPELFLR